MTNIRFTSRFLLTAISSVIVLPAFAGQIAHHTLAHGVPALAHRVTVVHQTSRVRVHRTTRVVHTRIVSAHPHEVVVETHVTAVRPVSAITTTPVVVSSEPTHRWGTSIAGSSAILTEPSADAKIIKRIPAGTHVPDIIGEVNGYYQYVRWTHKIAYVAKGDVQLGSGAAVAEPPHDGEPGQ